MNINDPVNDSVSPVPKGSAVDLSDVVGKEVCETILESFRGRMFYLPKTDTASSEAIVAVIGRVAVETLRNAGIKRVKANIRDGRIVGWSNQTYSLSQQNERLIRDAAIYERYVSGRASISELMVSSLLSRPGVYAALKRQRRRIADGDLDG